MKNPPSLVRLFLTHTLHFFTVAMALYFIAEVYSKVSRDSLITETMKCKYCRKSISRKVGDEACTFVFYLYLVVTVSRPRDALSAAVGKTGVKTLTTPPSVLEEYLTSGAWLVRMRIPGHYTGC
jgi:hypothetical protein